MTSKVSKKGKADTNNLFEHKDNIPRVNEPNTAYSLNTIGTLNSRDGQALNNNSKEDIVKSNYLASSINFLSFLSDSFNLTDSKILSFIEAYLIIMTLNRVTSHKSVGNLLYQRCENDFLIDRKNRELSKIFFYMISDNMEDNNLSADSKKLSAFLKKLLAGIEEAKQGVKTIYIVLDFLRKSKETKKFNELYKFTREYKTNDFSQLNEIADQLIALLSNIKQDDFYLQTWKVIIGGYIWVLRYSSQNVEVLIDDLFKKKNLQFKELHIVLIGIFAIKLFHSAPSWKPIGLSYQLQNKMKILQPAAEVFYNPSIITSLSSDTKKQEEYFWTYIWGKPYSMFEKPEVNTITKYQKKQIWVEEEVEIVEKTYGSFIKVLGQPKPTGNVKLKINI